MKIITKDNYDRDLFQEITVATQVDLFTGSELVRLWNDKYWTEQSQYYLELVEDDYICYNSYEDI